MNAQEKELEALEKRLFRLLRTASTRYGLIADGDRILVGLSGGKDSFCLLELLARQSRIFRPSFSVEALHVRMKEVQYESDAHYMQAFCNKLSVPLHIVTASLTESSAEEHNRSKPICFLCSWNRRKALFNFAQEHGFNKIALGHHQDDLIHTALMNLNFQGHFSTMPARLEMKKMPLTIIRPLCLMPETDIQHYATLRAYEPLLKRCPHEQETQRTQARRLFDEFQKLNPEARYSIWNALESAGKLIECQTMSDGQG